MLLSYVNVEYRKVECKKYNVVDGQNVVNSIEQDDVMNSVKIIRKGSKAKSFDANKTFKSAQDEMEKKKAEKAKQTAEALIFPFTFTLSRKGNEGYKYT